MRRILLICATLTVLACAAEDDETSEPVSLDGLGAELAQAQCEKILRCCSADELQNIFSGVTVENEEQCRELVSGYTRVFLVPAIEDAANTDSVRLDLDARDACIESLRTQQCGTFTPSPNFDLFAVEACGDFVSASLEISEFCAEDFECKSGFCARAPGANDGSCKTPPAEDEPCLNERCGAGLYCSQLDAKCLPRFALDESCERNEQCRSNNCLERMDGSRTCGDLPVACTE